MKIFCDYHHAGLYASIHRLFVDRLGAELYRPIGLEWAEKGIWRYSQELATQRQYLDKVGVEPHPSGYYTSFENSEGINHRLLTFEQFYNTPIDLVLATVSEHETSFFNLQQNCQPKAAFIRLIGNCGEPVDWSISRNVLDTTGLYEAPPLLNMATIHQEFSLDTFHYEPPKQTKKIKSFVNCIRDSGHYDEYQALRSALPEFSWFEHGHHGADGFLNPVSKVAEAMRDSDFICHLKTGGEGFGHIIHNAFAVGRPPITVKGYYKGKIADPLIIPGETAVCLDNLTLDDAVSLVRKLGQPDKHLRICENAAKRFRQIVNFDYEADVVRSWLDRI